MTGMQEDSLDSPNQMPPQEILVEKVMAGRGEHHVNPTVARVMAETSSPGQLQRGSPVGVSGWPPRQPWDVIQVTFLAPRPPSLIIHPPGDFVNSIVSPDKPFLGNIGWSELCSR